MSSETPNQGEEAVCVLVEVPGGEGNWGQRRSRTPPRAGARHSLAVTKGSRPGGGPGGHLACAPRLGPLGWAGCGASPCLPGAAKGSCCWVLEDAEREREEAHHRGS